MPMYFLGAGTKAVTSMWKVAILASWISCSTCESWSFNYYCPSSLRCEFLQNNFPKPSCYYRCCSGWNWYRGQFPDGTRCLRQRITRAVGQCMRGNCISLTGGGTPGAPPTYPSRPSVVLPSCNDIPVTVGYAQSCQVSCISDLNVAIKQNYPNNVPCLEIRPTGDKPASVAGLCREGKCIPYFNLDEGEINVFRKVFPSSLYKCPEKIYLGKNAVYNCRHYCKQENKWFFGSLMGNTTCQGDDPNRTGWCCKGDCHTEMWCGRSENDLEYPIQ